MYKSNCTHVIFDLDGAVLDTKSFQQRIFTSIAQKYGRICPPGIVNTIGSTVDLPTISKVLNKLQLPLNVEQLQRKYKSEEEKLIDKLDLLPGVENLLDYFHKNNIPIALATQLNSDEFQQKTKQFQNLLKLFKHIVMGDDPEVKFRKPNPDIFIVCANRFTDKPELKNVLIIDNDHEAVYAATKAGMPIVLLSNGNVDPKLAQKATVLKSLEEFEPEMFGFPPMKTEDEESVTSEQAGPTSVTFME